MASKLNQQQKTAIILAVITAITGWVGIVLSGYFAKNDSKDTPSIPATEVSEAVKKEESEIASKLSRNLIYGRYDEVNDNFSNDLKIALPTSKIQQITDSLKTKLGDYQGDEGLDFRVMNDGFHHVTISSRFSKRNLVVLVIFDKEHRVFGLWTKDV